MAAANAATLALTPGRCETRRSARVLANAKYCSFRSVNYRWVNRLSSELSSLAGVSGEEVVVGGEWGNCLFSRRGIITTWSTKTS